MFAQQVQFVRPTFDQWRDGLNRRSLSEPDCSPVLRGCLPMSTKATSPLCGCRSELEYRV
jgi:hypothetical protein